MFKERRESPNFPDNLSIFEQASDPRLKSAVEDWRDAWRENGLTPGVIVNLFDNFWRVGGEIAGRKFKVPGYASAIDTERLATLRSKEAGVLLIPDEVMEPKGITLLDKFLPRSNIHLSRTAEEIRNGRESDYRFVDVDPITRNKGGFMIVPMATNPPFTGMTIEEAEKKFEENNVQGQRFGTYVVGGLVNGLRGEYFDQHLTSSRLPGTRYNGVTTKANFYSTGYFEAEMEMHDLRQLPHVGHRWEKVIR